MTKCKWKVGDQVTYQFGAQYTIAAIHGEHAALIPYKHDGAMCIDWLTELFPPKSETELEREELIDKIIMLEDSDNIADYVLANYVRMDK